MCIDPLARATCITRGRILPSYTFNNSTVLLYNSRYKIEWHHFNLQPSVSCTADYLSLYDADMNSISNVSTLIGTFCGGQVDITGYPTQRYLTLKFHTDGSAADNGWRLRATRYESRKYALIA